MSSENNSAYPKYEEVKDKLVLQCADYKGVFFSRQVLKQEYEELCNNGGYSNSKMFDKWSEEYKQGLVSLGISELLVEIVTEEKEFFKVYNAYRLVKALVDQGVSKDLIVYELIKTIGL